MNNRYGIHWPNYINTNEVTIVTTICLYVLYIELKAIYRKILMDSSNLLYKYLKIKRSHHVRREGLEITILIEKRKALNRWILWRSKGLEFTTLIKKETSPLFRFYDMKIYLPILNKKLYQIHVSSDSLVDTHATLTHVKNRN